MENFSILQIFWKKPISLILSLNSCIHHPAYNYKLLIIIHDINRKSEHLFS